MAVRKRKRFLRTFFITLAFLLLCANALIIWVMTGPRSIPMLAPLIAHALVPAGSPYTIEIASSQLAWEGWKHPIVIHVKQVEVMNAQGAVVATFPEVGVHIRLLQLLEGKIDLKSINVLRPAIVLVQKEDGNISFGFETNKSVPSQETPIAVILSYFASDENADALSHLNSVLIQHAILTIRKGHSSTLLQSPDASLEIIRSRGDIKGKLSIPLRTEHNNAEVNADFTLNRHEKTIMAETVYTDIPSSVFSQFFPAQHWMESIQMPLSGWAFVNSDYNLKIDNLKFLVEAGAGSITYPSQFEKPLELNRIRVEGALTENLNNLSVKKGVIDFKTSVLNFNGTVHKQGDDYGIDATANVGRLPVNEIHNYWPLSLSPHTRSWVQEHISHGWMEKGELSVHFKPGELKLKDTPDPAINAIIEVQGATVQYLPKHPPVNDITGTVKFTGNTMSAQISSAKYMKDTVVKSATVRFPDLNAANVRLFLDMNVIAPAKEVVAFLSLPDLDKAKLLNLTSDIIGTADGNAKVDFIAFSENDANNVATNGHINYLINANLTNVAQPKFMGYRDVTNATMKIGVNNHGITANGQATINTVPMTIDLTTAFEKGTPTNYAIKCDMPLEKFAAFNLPDIAFAKGIIGVDAKFLSSEKKETADAMLDLTNASLNLPEHNFSKRIKEKATLQLSTERRGDSNTVIKFFRLTGKDMSASGKGEFEAKTGDFKTLEFDNLRYRQQDLNKLEYAKIPGGIKLLARGRSFDASPYLLKSNKNNVSQVFNIDIKTDRLLLAPTREVKNISIEADCADQCHFATIDATLPSGTKFNYVISNGKLNASCANAGELLRVLGVSDAVRKGKIEINGTYSEGKLKGEALMTDYELRNAPVLTRIFTIASLTGLLDTMTGNGISFSKMSAPFTYRNDVITLKEAKAHGSALGVTADGTIDLRSSTILDLKGVLVPSYTLNSLVGNIPLIGDILIGGTGKGLIALNYSVKGDINDPAVNVNPLSVLTPGFLRGVFDIFDKPAPDLDKIEAERRKELQNKAANATASAPPLPATNTAPPVTQLPAPATTP